MLDTGHLRREAREAPESGIVSVINYARGREGLIPLWAGEGDLSTPSFISDAASASLKAGETFYTWQRGLPELREALADYASRLYGKPLPAERFFVTSSGMHAIQLAVAMLAGAGDEVAFVGPAWPNLAAAVGIGGARAVEVPLDPVDGRWHLDLDRLAGALGPRTKALFVNTPGNPTGWTADRETLRQILAIARERGCAIIADEIYSRFAFEPVAGPGAVPRAPSFHDVEGEGDRIVFVNSFSKNWAMTGWRIGWIETSAGLGDVVENLVQYSTSGVPAFIQRGAIAALREGEPFIAMQVERAREARDIFHAALLATNRVEASPPAGAFYAFFAVDGMEDTRAAAFRICDEAGVGLAPGTAFGPAGRRFLRACFHRRLDEVEASAERLARWIGRAA